MDLLAPQSSGGTADGRRLTALTVRVFFVRRAKFERACDGDWRKLRHCIVPAPGRHGADHSRSVSVSYYPYRNRIPLAILAVVTPDLGFPLLPDTACNFNSLRTCAIVRAIYAGLN